MGIGPADACPDEFVDGHAGPLEPVEKRVLRLAGVRVVWSMSVLGHKPRELGEERQVRRVGKRSPGADEDDEVAVTESVDDLVRYVDGVGEPHVSETPSA